jgi:mannosyltransferase
MLIPVRTGPAVSVAQARTRLERIPPELVLLTVITAVGLAIRVATLGSQSYWVDEATTVHDVGRSLGGLLHQVHVNETTPPLYFVLVWVWSKLFGTGEVALRSLSLLCGLGTIPVAYLAGRELVSRAAGLVAALLVAVSPFMVWYSQEARAYALFALLSGLSFLFWARSWRRAKPADVWLWALFSALAVLTHFFAGFLVGAEGLLLLYRLRTRVTALACTAVALVQLAVLPLAIGDTSHPLGWIQTFPLSVRVKQVPVDFGLSSLYQSSLVNQGLLGAAVVAVVAAALVRFGSRLRSERTGAALAAVLAGAVLLVPLVLAWLGRDYYVPRNLIAAWLPVAVVLAAACTAPRARVAGAAFCALLLAMFVYAGIRIDRSAQYQRPNWRGVAAALGRPAGAARAIVAYDGNFAAEPLAVYLPGVRWPPRTNATVTAPELDVVGSTWQTTPAQLPPGVRLLARTPVAGGLLVARFALSPQRRLTRALASAQAAALLTPAPAAPSVLIQR